MKTLHIFSFWEYFPKDGNSRTQAGGITDISLRDAEKSDELRSFTLFSKPPTCLGYLPGQGHKGLVQVFNCGDAPASANILPAHGATKSAWISSVSLCLLWLDVWSASDSGMYLGLRLPCAGRFPLRKKKRLV